MKTRKYTASITIPEFAIPRCMINERFVDDLSVHLFAQLLALK